MFIDIKEIYLCHCWWTRRNDEWTRDLFAVHTCARFTIRHPHCRVIVHSLLSRLAQKILHKEVEVNSMYKVFWGKPPRCICWCEPSTPAFRSQLQQKLQRTCPWTFTDLDQGRQCCFTNNILRPPGAYEPAILELALILQGFQFHFFQGNQVLQYADLSSIQLQQYSTCLLYFFLLITMFP